MKRLCRVDSVMCILLELLQRIQLSLLIDRFLIPAVLKLYTADKSEELTKSQNESRIR